MSRRSTRAGGNVPSPTTRGVERAKVDGQSPAGCPTGSSMDAGGTACTTQQEAATSTSDSNHIVIAACAAFGLCALVSAICFVSRRRKKQQTMELAAPPHPPDDFDTVISATTFATSGDNVVQMSFTPSEFQETAMDTFADAPGVPPSANTAAASLSSSSSSDEDEDDGYLSVAGATSAGAGKLYDTATQQGHDYDVASADLGQQRPRTATLWDKPTAQAGPSTPTTYDVATQQQGSALPDESNEPTEVTLLESEVVTKVTDAEMAVLASDSRSSTIVNPSYADPRTLFPADNQDDSFGADAATGIPEGADGGLDGFDDLADGELFGGFDNDAPYAPDDPTYMDFATPDYADDGSATEPAYMEGPLSLEAPTTTMPGTGDRANEPAYMGTAIEFVNFGADNANGDISNSTSPISSHHHIRLEMDPAYMDVVTGDGAGDDPTYEELSGVFGGSDDGSGSDGSDDNLFL